jgi:hypothetical protein
VQLGIQVITPRGRFVAIDEFMVGVQLFSKRGGVFVTADEDSGAHTHVALGEGHVAAESNVRKVLLPNPVPM